MRVGAWFGVLALLTLFVVAWKLGAAPRDVGLDTPVVAGTEQQPDAQVVADAPTEAQKNEAGDAAGAPDVRTAVTAADVTLDGGGTPRRVTWRWIPIDERFDAPTWLLEDWAAVRSLPVSSGQLADEPLVLDAPVGDHVLWVFPDGAPSMWSVVRDDPVVLNVTPGSVAKLRVSLAGALVPGATVELFGTGNNVGGGLGPKVAAKTFYRRLTTGSDGAVAVERWAGDVAIVASLAGQRSRAVVTKFASEVELELVSTFRLRGRVGDGTSALSGELVEVGTVGEAVWETLAQGVVSADGNFALNDIPLSNTDEVYVQLLTRSSIAPQLAYRPAPQAGETLRIDFPAELARALTVEVLDANGAPLRNVAVMLSWGEATSSPHASEWLQTGAAGTVRFAAVRVGPIAVTTLREKHGERRWPTAEPEAWSGGEISLRYEASREITLRTQSTNLAVPEQATFLHWRTNSAQAVPIELKGSALKLSLEEGLHWFLAYAPGRARTTPQLVQVGVDPLDDLVFTLDAPRRAHGRLVDGVGNPFVGGLVQPYVNAGSQLLAPFGEALVSDAEGQFAGVFLAPGDNRLIVQAPGGNPAIYTFSGDDGAPGALGDIPIHASKSLTFQLSDELVRWGVHSLALTGGVRREAARTSASGSFTFEGCAPGKYRVQLEHPDGSFSIMSLTQSPRGPWGRVLGSSDAIVLTHDPELVSLAIRERANQLHITTWIEELGCSVTRVVAIGEEPVTVANLSAGPATLQWATAEGEIIARSDMNLARGVAALARPGEPVRSAIIAFETADGEPLVGATIWYAHPGGSGAWDGVAATGSDGRGRLDGVVGETVLLGITHPLLGYAFDVELALAGAAHEGRVIVHADSSLHVRLMDGMNVARGLEVSLACPTPDMTLMSTVPAADGWTRFGRLGEGRYQVRIQTPRWFPVAETIRVSGRTEHTIDVYRTGALELTLTRAGEPGAGIRIDLEADSIELNIATCLSDGRVGGSLVADGAGKILLSGLPRGQYVARVEGRQIRLEVLPDELVSHRIDLP